LFQNGFDAFFTNCAALVDDFSRVGREGRLVEMLPTYTMA